MLIVGVAAVLVQLNAGARVHEAGLVCMAANRIQLIGMAEDLHHQGLA